MLLIGPVVSAQPSPVELMRQADAVYRAGNADRAAVLFRQVLQLDPKATPAHMFLGIISSQRAEWADAIEHFEAVVKVTPANAHAQFFLGTAYAAEGKWTEAAQSFSKARENKFPQQDRLLIALASAQSEAGQPKQALASLQSIARPADKKLASEYHSTQATAHQRLDQPTLAIVAIRRALESNNYDARHWQFLVSSLLSIGQVELALKEAIEASKRFPDQPDIQYQFGVAGYFVQELPFTETALRNLREATPRDPRVSVLEGLVSNKQGQAEQANQAFRAGAGKGIPESYLFLGLALHEQGDQVGAEKALRQALRHLPHDGQVFLAMGKVLATTNPEEALSYMKKAESYMPGNPTLHYSLGTLYRRLNQPDQAKRHLELFRKFRQEEEEMMERDRAQ